MMFSERDLSMIRTLFSLAIVICSTIALVASAADVEIPRVREFPVSMDVSPCESLHAYACQAVEKSFQLPPTRSRYVFSFNDSHERLLSAKMEFILKLAGRGTLKCASMYAYMTPFLVGHIYNGVSSSPKTGHESCSNQLRGFQ